VTTVADATLTVIFAPLARSDFKVQPAHTSNFCRFKYKKSSRPERDVHLRDPDFKQFFVQDKTAQTNNSSASDCIDDAQKSDQLAFFKNLLRTFSASLPVKLENSHTLVEISSEAPDCWQATAEIRPLQRKLHLQ
jgi:hypothetical protein